MPERILKRSPDEILPHSGTLSLERAFALRRVLDRFQLPFRIVAEPGAPYPDGNARVPKGAAFVTYDTGDIPKQIIDRMVEEIAPTPMLDGKR